MAHDQTPVAPVVEPDELARMLADGDGLVILDARWSLTGPPSNERYASAHLPGAVWVDVDRDLAGTPGTGGRHPLPAARDFEDAMRRLGVREDRPVVAYDDGEALGAARAWWTLRYFGHRDVRLLRGGLAAWSSAGLPLTGETPTVTAGTFRAAAGGMPLLDADDAARLAQRGALLDVRARSRYTGEHEPVDPVAGHIPGALNAPELCCAADGRFPDSAEVRSYLGEIGVSPSSQIGTYCGSGITAARAAFTLAHAGLPHAVYVGSWSDWITDSTRPTAIGDGLP